MAARIVFVSRAFSSSRKQHVYLRKVCEDYMNKLVDVCKSSAKDDTKEQAYGKRTLKSVPASFTITNPIRKSLSRCYLHVYKAIMK